MSGVVCLQGGAELGADCRDMDRRVLALAGDGDVVVLPLAAAASHEYDTAGDNARRYYVDLVGGGRDVVVAPDPRSAPGAGTEAAALVEEAAVVVLPGGSPGRLLDALRRTGIDVVLDRVLSRGAALSGASAGAMVLGPVTVVPDRGGRVETAVAVTRYALVPHWSPSDADRGRRWVDALTAAAPGIPVLGLPEQSGVVVHPDGTLEAVGRDRYEVLAGGDG